MQGPLAKLKPFQCSGQFLPTFFFFFLWEMGNSRRRLTGLGQIFKYNDAFQVALLYLLKIRGVKQILAVCMFLLSRSIYSTKHDSFALFLLIYPYLANIFIVSLTTFISFFFFQFLFTFFPRPSILKSSLPVSHGKK